MKMEPISPGNVMGYQSNSRIPLQQGNTADRVLIDYRHKQSLFMGARFIFECGSKLDATPITIATATSMFHRFFKEVDMTNYDVYLIGATCLYLAGKVENDKIKIRDTINVAHATVNRNAQPLDLAETYFAFKEAIHQAELLMMRVLQFKISFDHPHKYLTHYLKTIEEWVGYDASCKHPIARTAWAILQDFHHDVSVIEYPPEAIAVAAIHLTLQIYGAQIPLCSDQGRNGWQIIMYPDVQQETQNEILLKMVMIYELEEDLLSRSAYKGTISSNGK